MPAAHRRCRSLGGDPHTTRAAPRRAENAGLRARLPRSRAVTAARFGGVAPTRRGGARGAEAALVGAQLLDARERAQAAVESRVRRDYRRRAVAALRIRPAAWPRIRARAHARRRMGHGGCGARVSSAELWRPVASRERTARAHRAASRAGGRRVHVAWVSGLPRVALLTRVRSADRERRR
eukprot:5922693-Prymnesium_polylepis.3